MTTIQLHDCSDALVVDYFYSCLDKTTTVQIGDNEQLWVYKRSRYVGTNAAKGGYAIGKAVKHLHKCIFSRTYKDITLRYVRTRQRLYYFSNVKTVTLAGGATARGGFRVEVKFMGLQRRTFAKYIAANGITADDNGVLVHLEPFKKLIADTVESTLPQISDIEQLAASLVALFAAKGIVVTVGIKR